MNAIIEQILERFETLEPTARVFQRHPYPILAFISGNRDALWLSCYERGTVRLEYINNCGETEAELILSAEHTLAELTGSREMMGPLVYVAERIVPDLDARFHSDPDVIRAKQSETYQKLNAGETHVISVVHHLESEQS